LIGSSKLVLETGDIPAYIAIGAAAGLKRFLDEKGLEQTAKNAENLLMETSGLTQDSNLLHLILDMYSKITEGVTISQLRRAADVLKASNRKNII